MIKKEKKKKKNATSCNKYDWFFVHWFNDVNKKWYSPGIQMLSNTWVDFLQWKRRILQVSARFGKTFQFRVNALTHFACFWFRSSLNCRYIFRCPDFIFLFWKIKKLFKNSKYLSFFFFSSLLIDWLVYFYLKIFVYGANCRFATLNTAVVFFSH